MAARRTVRGAGLTCALLGASALTGCLKFPEYRAPEIDLPDRYSLLVPIAVSSVETAQWWRLFEDPLLNQLVARLLAENLDLKEAEERVTEAQGIARREGNTVSGNANLDANARNGIDTAGFDLSLTLSPFGRERSESEAALKRLEAANFELQSAKLAVGSELMLAYVDLRFFQKTYSYRLQDLASRKASLDATRTLLRQGAATRLDEIRLEALVAETRADIPRLSSDITRQENRIAVLLGSIPQKLAVDLNYTGKQPYPPKVAEVGIPADLLRRRSDIRAAERTYAAAASEINAAEAARYPSLTLSGNISAPLESDLSKTRGVGLGFNIPVFNQPGLAAQTDINRSRASQAYLQWSQLVLTAMADVETALTAVKAAHQEVVAAQNSLRLNLEALKLSQELYTDGGTVTVVELLDIERAVTAARSTLAFAVRSYATEVITLHVALGIGFEK